MISAILLMSTTTATRMPLSSLKSKNIRDISMVLTNMLKLKPRNSHLKKRKRLMKQ